MITFDLVLRTGASLHTLGEPDQFIAELEGVIVCEDEDEVRRTVGRVLAKKVHVSVAADRG